MVSFTLSPKRDLNLNNLRVALFNFVVSRQRGEGFIIVVDDINLDSKNSKEAQNLDILKKFAIDTQKIVYRSKNLNIYQEFAYRLVKDKKAFVCFCQGSNCTNNCKELSNQDLKSLKDSGKEFNIKVFKPLKEYSFNDVIFGDQKSNIEQINEFTILNSDGTPTEIFASAIDAMVMGISLIIREEEFLKDSAKEIYIRELLDFTQKINYAHIPKILSKEEILIKNLFIDGFIPDAIINYIFLLNLEPPKELFYLPDVIEWFDITKVSNKRVEFDLERLKSLNKKHLQKMDSIKLSSIFGFRDSDIGELLKILLKNATTINELEEKFKPLFSKKECSSDMKKLSKIILEAPFIESYDNFINYLKQKTQFTENELIVSLKALLLGNKECNIELKDIYPYIKSYLLEVAQCQ